MIDDAIYQRRGPAGELLPAVPLPDAAAPALFASFTGALAGAEDGPADVSLLGTTRGTTAMVKRAESRLGVRSRATPPKQILQLLVGRTRFVNFRTFGVVDLDAIARAHAGVVDQLDIMAAGGAIVKAAGKPAPKTWPEVNSYERMKNVIDGMCIALEDAPLVFREGLDRLADEMLSRHNAEPTLSWTRMYKLLVDLAGKRAKIMDRADANHVAVTLLPWDTLDIEFEMQLATEVATMKCVDEARRAADAKAAASGGGDGGGGRGRDGGGEGKSRDDKRKKERDAEREREREKKRKRESERDRDRNKRERDGGGRGGRDDRDRRGDRDGRRGDSRKGPPPGYRHGDEIRENWICNADVWRDLAATKDYCYYYCINGSCRLQADGTCRRKHEKPPSLARRLYRGP